MKGLSKGRYDETFAGEDGSRIASSHFVNVSVYNELSQTTVAL